jgi:hypothetical protein
MITPNLRLVEAGEQLWIKSNLWDRILPNMGLSVEDRILLGGLADIETYSDDPTEILTHLYESARRGDRSSPMAVLKGLCGLDRAYEILIDNGYETFQPARSQLQIGLRRFTLTALRSLTRSMLSTDSDEEAEWISDFLADVITKGQWTQAEFSSECEAWAAELQSRMVC